MPDSFVTPWTVTCQAPLSIGFPRQEYWSGLPFPSPGDLPDSGIKPMPPALAGGFFTTEPLCIFLCGFIHLGILIAYLVFLARQKHSQTKVKLLLCSNCP